MKARLTADSAGARALLDYSNELIQRSNIWNKEAKEMKVWLARRKHESKALVEYCQRLTQRPRG